MMPSKHYDVFKHRVRQKLPKKIRYATVCRKCKKETLADRCFTCIVEEAMRWTKPYQVIL